MRKSTKGKTLGKFPRNPKGEVHLPMYNGFYIWHGPEWIKAQRKEAMKHGEE